MNAKRLTQLPLGLAFAGTLLAGCTVAAGSSEPAVSASTPSFASAEPAESPSTASTASLPPEVPPSVESSPNEEPSTAAVPPEPTLVPPPSASISVEGGDPVVGELGSWSWLNSGSDAPWLPGYPIHVGTGEHLTFWLSETVRIDHWQVARVPPSSIPGDTGSVGMGEGASQLIRFPAPPRGTWSVSVSVWFSVGGSAVYYWAVTVD